MKQRLRAIFNRLHNSYLSKVAALTVMCFPLMNGIAHAADLGTANKSGILSKGGLSNFEMPWDKFLKSLAQAMTGPFAMVVGILALAGAAFALFKGNGGPATEKIILVCIGVAIVFFAPTIIEYMQESAGGFVLPAVLP